MTDKIVEANERCPCGSGEAYENCCEGREDLDDMLEEWMENGYRIIEEKENDKRGVEIWWNTWQIVKRKTPRSLKECKTMDENVFDFDFYVRNWINDFAQSLIRTAEDDDTYAEIGVQYNQQLLERFPKESDLFLRNRKQDLSRMQYLNGNPEQAVETARAMIDEEPDKAAGYAALSDVYVYSDDPNYEDYERAAEIIEEGLENVSEEEARSYDLEYRLEQYRDKA